MIQTTCGASTTGKTGAGEEAGRGSWPVGQLPARAQPVREGGGGQRGMVDPTHSTIVHQVKKSNLCFNVQ